MIAHRLSTVRNCDCIFLLEQGRVSAAGTYEELVAGSEIFRRMAVG
jgi:HlyD family secretion protein